MDNKDFTIPKNIILNWLYTADRHVSCCCMNKKTKVISQIKKSNRRVLLSKVIQFEEEV